MVAMGVAPRRSAQRTGHVRLTRRGRVVAVVLLALLYLSLAVAVVAVGSTASRAADPPGPPQVVVVQPRDTLWSIAERHLAGHEPFAAVDQIRRLNDIDDYTVHPGQHLTLPPNR